MSTQPKNRNRMIAIAAVAALILAIAVFFATREPSPQPSAASAKTVVDAATPTPTPAGAVPVEPAVPDAVTSDAPFSVANAANREFDGFPALALSFSQPLDAKKDYGAYIQVLDTGSAPVKWGEDDEEVSKTEIVELDGDFALEGQAVSVPGAWVVGDNPRLMFFPHVKPRTRYIVRVMSGLPGKGDLKLQEEKRYQITTPIVAPAYYFASRGTILPASQNGGLPVVTVNVPEVDVQFLKVRADQMPKFMARVVAPHRSSDEYYDADKALRGAVSLWQLEAIHKMTESVYIGRFLTEQKPNRRNVTFLPVESLPALREPGVYIAVMSQPNRFRYEYQTTYFYVSDLGMHVRQYANQSADVFVNALSSGKGVSGVEVAWLSDEARVLSFAETGSDGHVSFKERPKDAKVVMAKKGGQISLITLKEPALDLAEFDIAGSTPSPTRLFAWSGRDLYRPGESFDVSVLARGSDGQGVPAQPIQAVFRRPDGKSQWTETWQPDQAFGGYYRRKIELPLDAPTGFWNLELRSDPAAKLASTAMRISVEEFLPERMKLELSSGLSSLGADDDAWPIQVAGNYLYGAPAGGNRLLGVTSMSRNPNPLAKQLPGFVFGDVNEDSVRSRGELSTSLDDAGRAAVNVDVTEVKKRLSPFTVRATLSLLESGGRPVVRSIERVWWPAEALVGLRPLFDGAYAPEDSQVGFEIVRANSAGELKAAAALQVRVFSEDRHYYWSFDDSRGWHSGYTETDELTLTTSLSIPAGGRGKLTVPVKYGRYRVEILDPDTQLTARYRFYAGWYSKGDETQGIRPDRVALKFDKPAYAEGETAKLTIKPPHAGEALVTVEGDKLLWKKSLSVGADGATVEIPIDKAWKRHDLYAAVMVVRPGSPMKTEGERVLAGVTPARALGLAHLPLDRAARKLTVTLDAPQKMEPETPLVVKVKVPEAYGRKAMLTLSAVDAGILNITRFASPDPFGFYFGKQRYNHDLYDVYGRLIEKMAGQKGKLKWGGDSSASAQTKEAPKKVRLVDLFSGPVELADDGTAEVRLNVPDFNGTLRLMAVVASDGNYGMRDAEVVVAAPLVVELNTPRFLSIGDAAFLALDVHNLAGGEQKIKINVKSGGGLKILNGAQQLTLKDQEKKILRIPMEAGDALGLTEVSIDIDSPRKKFSRTFAIQVQAPTPRQSVARFYTVDPGDALEIKESDLHGFVRKTVTGTLVASNKPPIDVRSAVQGLVRYPYGCAEQTTSTAYPHVFIDEESAKRFGLKEYSLKARAEMIDKSIGRLAGMQGPNGAFSLWGNYSEYQYWLSSYVTHFLLDAREQGFSVPDEMEKKAVEFLLKGLQEGVSGIPKQQKSSWNSSVWSDYCYAGNGRFGVLAYGAYVLARHGKAPLSTLRQMAELKDSAHSRLALIQLGLALKLAGDEKLAKDVIGAGMQKVRDDQHWWGDYGSDLRDSALSYVLLQKHDVKPEGRDSLVLQVSEQLKNKNYLSTQEQMAVFLLGRNFLQAEDNDWKAEIVRKGKTETLVESYLPVEGDEIRSGVKIRNTHTEPLFLQLNYSGHPEKALAAKDDVFKLKREWFDAEGAPLFKKGRAAWDEPEAFSRPLRVGETLTVRVLVASRATIANALVVDYIPAGFEIENVNLAQSGQEPLRIQGKEIDGDWRDSRIKHVEFRDDRFAVSMHSGNRDERALFYRVRVVTPGRFVIPPIYAEDMYQPSVYGVSASGATLTVLDGVKP